MVGISLFGPPANPPEWVDVASSWTIDANSCHCEAVMPIALLKKRTPSMHGACW
jgi:hypothetical protein